ncbi:ribosomal protein-like protein S18 [Xylogone sp. PMI_703]|nr:ribosomal protein-like protein S18 [Xylogone sp. PMI_703]
MPPRLQCLHITQPIRQRASLLQASFSTSHRVLAENGRQTPTPTGLLSNLDSQHSFENPIRSDSGATPSVTNRNLLNLINRAGERRLQQRNSGPALETIDEIQKHLKAADITKQISRRWKPGDVYAPHDLTGVEMQKWRQRRNPETDVFDILDLNPLDEYKNFSILSEYMTPMGRIKHSRETGLRPVNQRRIAKAIRRSIGMGMMPSVHRHPEILRKMQLRSDQNSPFRTGAF